MDPILHIWAKPGLQCWAQDSFFRYNEYHTFLLLIKKRFLCDILKTQSFVLSHCGKHWAKLWMSVTKQHRIYMCVMYIVRLYAYIEQCTVHLVIIMEQYISKDHQLGTFDAKIEILYSTIYSMSKICSWPAQSFAIFTLVTTSPNRGTESCK